MLNGLCHNNQMDGTYAINKNPEGGSRAITFYHAVERLKNFKREYVHALSQTSLELDDAVKVIKRYDSKYAFFYCDPPYPGTNCGHYGDYTLDEFESLLETLAEIKGKFMLSCFMNAPLREFIDAGKYHSKVFFKTGSAHKRDKNNPEPKRVKEEFVVMNYEPKLGQSIMF